MHLKRQQSPKTWPTHRKGTKYIVRANYSPNEGLPILIILRDLLQVAENRREVKKALYAGQILLNNKKVSDEKNNALLFDVISLIPSKTSGSVAKHYKLTIGKNKKFRVNEISEKEATIKIAKVTKKTTLKGKKMQINLSDGRNFISNTACKVGDSVLINLRDKKIEKALPIKKGSKVLVYAGKHAGETGVVEKVDEENHTITIREEDNTFNILIKQTIVLE